MARGVRERMVQSAIVLLAKRGYQATSFSEVLAESQAPRGSIYHHFPDGKDQLIAAAIEVSGARAVALLGGLAGSSGVESAIARPTTTLARTRVRGRGPGPSAMSPRSTPYTPGCGTASQVTGPIVDYDDLHSLASVPCR